MTYYKRWLMLLGKRSFQGVQGIVHCTSEMIVQKKSGDD